MKFFAKRDIPKFSPETQLVARVVLLASRFLKTAAKERAKRGEMAAALSMLLANLKAEADLEDGTGEELLQWARQFAHAELNLEPKHMPTRHPQSVSPNGTARLQEWMRALEMDVSGSEDSIIGANHCATAIYDSISQYTIPQIMIALLVVAESFRVQLNEMRSSSGDDMYQTAFDIARGL